MFFFCDCEDKVIVMATIFPGRQGYYDERFNVTDNPGQGVTHFPAYGPDRPTGKIPKDIWFTTPGETMYLPSQDIRYVRVTLLGAGGGCAWPDAAQVASTSNGGVPIYSVANGGSSGEEKTYYLTWSQMEVNESGEVTIKVGNGVQGLDGESSGFSKVSTGEFLFSARGGKAGVVKLSNSGDPIEPIDGAYNVVTGDIEGTTVENGQASFYVGGVNGDGKVGMGGQSNYGGSMPIITSPCNSGGTFTYSEGYAAGGGQTAHYGYGCGCSGGLMGSKTSWGPPVGTTGILDGSGQSGLVRVTEFYW